MPSTQSRVALTIAVLVFPAAMVTAQQRPEQSPDRPGVGQAAQEPEQRQPETTISREPVPEPVREAEADIERQFKRFGAGFRGGFALDPELVIVGAHATIGPFFRRGIAFRPNVEFGFGEITTMYAINLEAVYYLPFSRTNDNERFYFGAGPGFNFLSRGIPSDYLNGPDNNGGDNDFDRFDDFDFDASLNLVGGVEWRNGGFVELKAAAYGGPTIRLLIGYTF